MSSKPETRAALRADSSATLQRDASPLPDVKFKFSPSYGSKEPLSTPHTVSVLVCLFGLILYAAFFSSAPASTSGAEAPVTAAETVCRPSASVGNTRNGVLAALAIGLIFCAEHLRDTLFIRPHPALWRFVTGVGLFYAMFFAFLLFQDVDFIRKTLMPQLDSTITGERPVQKPYGQRCPFTFENIWDACDGFFVAHFIGWICKHMMLRDVKLSMFLSFLFELMEYTFEYLQPNFVECWWDHWLLDFALCNTGGIIIGELLLRYFQSKSYDWAGFSEIPHFKGKIVRALQQFTPHSWTTPATWHMMQDFRRFCAVFIVCVGAMVIELDAFFLKDIFWADPPSKAPNLYRLGIWWLVGMVGLRDYFSYMTDSSVKRLGSTCWVMLSMLILEFLVVVKFWPELAKSGKVKADDRAGEHGAATTYTIPLETRADGTYTIPSAIFYAWVVVAVAIASFVVYTFALRAGGAAGHAADAPSHVQAPPAASADAAKSVSQPRRRGASAARESAAPSARPVAPTPRKHRELASLLADL